MQFQVPTGLHNTLQTYLSENETIDLKLPGRKKINGKLHFISVNRTFESKKLIKYLPYVYYLTDLYYSKKRNPKNFGKDWINFRWELLIKVIPQKTYPIIKSLIEKFEIFDINEVYLPARFDNKKEGFTKSFKLNDRFLYGKSEFIQFSSKLAENIRKKADIKLSDKRFDDLAGRIDFPEYHYLKTSFAEISVDPDAYTYIDNALRDEIELKDKQVKTKEGYYITVKDRRYNQESYNSDLRSLNLLDNKFYNPSISGSDNRLNTVYTSLRSDLRPYLKHKGRSLVNLDISSSQVIQLISKLKKDVNKLSEKLQVKKELLEAEIFCLTQLCQSGNLYHIIAEKCCESGIEVNKDEAKTMFFSKFMYCQNSTKSKYKKVIQSLFPLIMDAVHYYKRKDYKYLSNELTVQESEMMLNRIVRRVSIEVPDSVMITIHDACLVDADHVDEIYNIMLEEVEKFTGVVANIKVEDLHKEYDIATAVQDINSDIDKDYDFDTISEDIGDYDSDNQTVEDCLSVQVSEREILEKKITTLEGYLKEPYDPNDIFAVDALEVSKYQLAKAREKLKVLSPA